KIADNRFIHLIKRIVVLLDKQPDQYFLSNDLLSFVQEVCNRRFDIWMKKHVKDMYYRRYQHHFFISFKHEGLNVKQFTQKVEQFTKKHKLSLQTFRARPANKGIHFLGYKFYQHPSEICLQCDIPTQSIQHFIQQHDYGVWQTFTSTSRPYLLHLPERKIIQ